MDRILKRIARMDQATRQWSEWQEQYFLVSRYGTSNITNFKLFDYLLTEKGMKVIDVGMNGGFLVKTLVDRGYNAYGLDLPALADRARKDNPEVADRLFACNLEFEDIPGENYDVVLAQSVIEHLLRYNLFFSKVCKVLKPGGILFLTTCNRDAIEIEQAHTHHFTRKELRAMARKASMEPISIINTSPTNLIGTFRRVK